jgi:hypothetical protein
MTSSMAPHGVTLDWATAGAQANTVLAQTTEGDAPSRASRGLISNGYSDSIIAATHRLLTDANRSTRETKLLIFATCHVVAPNGQMTSMISTDPLLRVSAAVDSDEQRW